MSAEHKRAMAVEFALAIPLHMHTQLPKPFYHTHTHTPPSLEEALALDTTVSRPRESGVGVGDHRSGLVLREEFRSEFEMNEIRSWKRESENHQQQKTSSRQCMREPSVRSLLLSIGQKPTKICEF